jgi:hypothetical protein
MDGNATIRIQAEAARALAEWKAFFAEQVVLKARDLAKTATLLDSSHSPTIGRRRSWPRRLWRSKCREQTQTMSVKKQPDQGIGEISGSVNDWFRLFLKHLELHLVAFGPSISSESVPADYHFAAMQAVRLTLLDSGMNEDGFRDLLDKVATAYQRLVAIAETDAMGYPTGYFEATEGSFAIEPLECPPDLPLEKHEPW